MWLELLLSATRSAPDTRLARTLRRIDRELTRSADIQARIELAARAAGSAERAARSGAGSLRQAQTAGSFSAARRGLSKAA